MISKHLATLNKHLEAISGKQGNTSNNFITILDAKFPYYVHDQSSLTDLELGKFTIPAKTLDSAIVRVSLWAFSEDTGIKYIDIFDTKSGCYFYKGRISPPLTSLVLSDQFHIIKSSTNKYISISSDNNNNTYQRFNGEFNFENDIVLSMNLQGTSITLIGYVVEKIGIMA
jgi:hypothetical protein